MQGRLAHVAVTLAVVAALAAPGALGWGIQGAIEPDTPQDIGDGLMWGEPDTREGATPQRIYFNAVAFTAAQMNGVLINGAAARVPAAPVDTGSRIAPPPPLEFIAYFGTWKDCNRDGYVGSAHTALNVYPVQLLPDASTCPSGTPWNDGTNVREFRWIAPFAIDPRAGTIWHGDPEAGVWGDFGRPTDAPEPPRCAFAPLPRGSTANSGMAIAHADCQLGGALTLAAAETGVLAFDDRYAPWKDCDHPLVFSYGVARDPHKCADDRAALFESGTGRPLVAAWDCTRPDGTTLRDPTAPPEGGRGSLSTVTVQNPVPGFSPQTITVALADSEGRYARVPAVAPSYDTGGTVADSMNHAENGALRACSPPTNGGVPLGSYLDQNLVLLLGAVERRQDPAAPDAPKRSADILMFFDKGGVQGGPDNFDRGVHLVEQANGEGWHSSDEYRAGASYSGGLTRDGFEPASATWTTFYARVGTRLVDFEKPSLDRKYGSEACGGMTSGVHGGWDCDGTTWYPVKPGRLGIALFLPRPDMTYQSRDVDCYDGTLGSTGLRASPAALTGEPGCSPR